MVGLALCLLYLIEWRLCLFLKQRRSRPSLQKEKPCYNTERRYGPERVRLYNTVFDALNSVVK